MSLLAYEGCVVRERLAAGRPMNRGILMLDFAKSFLLKTECN